MAANARPHPCNCPRLGDYRGWFRLRVQKWQSRKGEPFANADATVSRKSVADLVVKLATTPGLGSRSSLGVHYEA